MPKPESPGRAKRCCWRMVLLCAACTPVLVALWIAESPLPPPSAPGIVARWHREIAYPIFQFHDSVYLKIQGLLFYRYLPESRAVFGFLAVALAAWVFCLLWSKPVFLTSHLALARFSIRNLPAMFPVWAWFARWFRAVGFDSQVLKQAACLETDLLLNRVCKLAAQADRDASHRKKLARQFEALYKTTCALTVTLLIQPKSTKPDRLKAAMYWQRVVMLSRAVSPPGKENPHMAKLAVLLAKIVAALLPSGDPATVPSSGFRNPKPGFDIPSLLTDLARLSIIGNPQPSEKLSEMSGRGPRHDRDSVPEKIAYQILGRKDRLESYRTAMEARFFTSATRRKGVFPDKTATETPEILRLCGKIALGIALDFAWAADCPDIGIAYLEALESAAFFADSEEQAEDSQATGSDGLQNQNRLADALVSEAITPFDWNFCALLEQRWLRSAERQFRKISLVDSQLIREDDYRVASMGPETKKLAAGPDFQ